MREKRYDRALSMPAMLSPEEQIKLEVEQDVRV